LLINILTQFLFFLRSHFSNFVGILAHLHAAAENWESNRRRSGFERMHFTDNLFSNFLLIFVNSNKFEIFGFFCFVLCSSLSLFVGIVSENFHKTIGYAITHIKAFA
jgi:hypothetical protein